MDIPVEISKDDRRRRYVNALSAVGESTLAVETAQWLDGHGYFTAPASTRFHGAYEGGLFDHSYGVARTLMDLTEKNGLVWQNRRSPILIGLFHDLCKVDKYKLVQDEDKKYDYIDHTVWGPGHGIKSAMVSSMLCKLTEEEMLCIRYHMGAYEKDEWNEYDAAIRRYPNVLWTHMANMLTSKVVGV